MRSTKRRLPRLLQIAVLLLLTLAPAGQTQARVEIDAAGSTDATPSLTLPQVVIPPDAEVVLDLKLSNNPGNVRGVDLTLAYAPAIVEFLSVSKGSLAADWMLVSNVHPNGLIDLALAGVTPPTGDVVLAQLSFRGGSQKGQASAVTFQRAQINEVDVSGSTQAGQITLDTPPITDLRAAVTTAGIHLTWSHVGSDAHHYEVWRATNLPYFVPPQGTPIAPNVAPNIDPCYDDGYSGIGNTAVNSFYLVRSVDAAGRPAPTYNRVGVFNFALKPGGS